MRELDKNQFKADKQAAGETVVLQQFFVADTHLVAVAGACLDVLQRLIRCAFGFRLIVGIHPAFQFL